MVTDQMISDHLLVFYATSKMNLAMEDSDLTFPLVGQYTDDDEPMLITYVLIDGIWMILNRQHLLSGLRNSTRDK